MSFMAKLWIPRTVAALCVPCLAPAWQQNNMHHNSWSGVIINSGCTVDEAFAESDKCFERRTGATLSLYDDTIRQIYELDAQDQAATHFGESVTVEGTLEGNTIHVASLKMLTAIGLEV